MHQRFWLFFSSFFRSINLYANLYAAMKTLIYTLIKHQTTASKQLILEEFPKCRQHIMHLLPILRLHIDGISLFL